MKVKFKFFLFLALTLIFCAGCSAENKGIPEKAPEINGYEFLKRDENKYAQKFAIDRYDGGYSIIHTMNSESFLIVPQGMEIPQCSDDDITVLQQPMTDIYLVATSAMGLFDELGSGDVIKFSGTKAEDWCIDYARNAMEKGDMLYAPLGESKVRVQGCFISDSEVAAVVDFVKKHSGAANYSDEVMHDIEQRAAEKDKSGKSMGGKVSEDMDDQYDELLDVAAEVVVEMGQASTSMLQRRLKLGYARAARLVDQLEEKGIVGPSEGSKPRKVLITKDQWHEMQYRQTMSDPGGYAAPRTPAPADAPPFEPDDPVRLDRAEEDVL